MLSETELRKQKSVLRMVHLFTMIDLGILSAVLWLNIPGIGGPIAGCTVIALILVYPFVAFNPSSWLNIWLEGMMHKLNMWTYRLYIKKTQKLPIKTSHEDPSGLPSHVKAVLAEGSTKHSGFSLFTRRNRFQTRKISRGLLVAILLSVGILQFYVFWLLYYVAEFRTLGCICGLIGTTLQFTGLIVQFLRKGTDNGPKWFILLVGLTGLFTWLYIYYGWMLFKVS